MQDTDISYSNDSNYGVQAPAAAITNLNQTGLYEYVKKRQAPVSGGFVHYQRARQQLPQPRCLRNQWPEQTFQVIPVPQYSSATVSSSVSALNWNGSVGGIVAMDVDSTLTITGNDHGDGAGFRGV